MILFFMTCALAFHLGLFVSKTQKPIRWKMVLNSKKVVMNGIVFFLKWTSWHILFISWGPLHVVIGLLHHDEIVQWIFAHIFKKEKRKTSTLLTWGHFLFGMGFVMIMSPIFYATRGWEILAMICILSCGVLREYWTTPQDGVFHQVQHAVAADVAACIAVVVGLVEFSFGAAIQVSALTMLGSVFSSILLITCPLLLAKSLQNNDHIQSGDVSVRRISLVSGAFLAVSLAWLQSLVPYLLVYLSAFFLYSIGLYLERYTVQNQDALNSFQTSPDSSQTSSFNKIQIAFFEIWNNPQSRNMSIFLCINSLFMLLELFVGWRSNSLSLLSDAGHMMFDNCALTIGILADHIGKWNKNDVYTYGYGRWEVLSGFVNSLFLLMGSLGVAWHALERFLDPPVVNTEDMALTYTSIGGLLVNIVGLYYFHDFAHGNCSHSHGSNENKYGVYLHILADTLGSVAAIISSLLIQYGGWYIADPLFSILTSALIFSVAAPVVSRTALTLVQSVPESKQRGYRTAVQLIQQLPELNQVHSIHLWQQSDRCLVASAHVVIHEGAVVQEVQQTIAAIFRKEVHVQNVTIQVDTSITSSHEASHQDHHHHHGHDHGSTTLCSHHRH